MKKKHKKQLKHQDRPGSDEVGEGAGLKQSSSLFWEGRLGELKRNSATMLPGNSFPDFPMSAAERNVGVAKERRRSQLCGVACHRHPS